MIFTYTWGTTWGARWTLHRHHIARTWDTMWDYRMRHQNGASHSATTPRLHKRHHIGHHIVAQCEHTVKHLTGHRVEHHYQTGHHIATRGCSTRVVWNGQRETNTFARKGSDKNRHRKKWPPCKNRSKTSKSFFKKSQNLRMHMQGNINLMH